MAKAPRDTIKNIIIENWFLFDLIYPFYLKRIGSTKHKTIKEYARRFSLGTFIETGLFYGNTVAVLRNTFSKIVSIELDKTLCEKAVKRFAKFEHITVVNGDSSMVLPEILLDISRPCLFWLDAHYWPDAHFPYGANDAPPQGGQATPVIRELECILDHSIRDHVILIDDADHYVGRDGWPPMIELEELVHSRRSDCVFEVKDRIIRIHKKEG